MTKLSEYYDGRFTISELKACWHNTEKNREEASQSSIARVLQNNSLFELEVL